MYNQVIRYWPQFRKLVLMGWWYGLKEGARRGKGTDDGWECVDTGIQYLSSALLALHIMYHSHWREEPPVIARLTDAME